MTIKIKAHQQFYALYLAFFFFGALLLLSFYSLFSLKVYQLNEQATLNHLISIILPQEINILLMKLGIAASFLNFYLGILTLITLCILILVFVFFKLNSGWKKTYLSYAHFIEHCIDNYQEQQKGKVTSDDDLFDSIIFNEQLKAAEFFFHLKPVINNITPANSTKIKPKIENVNVNIHQKHKAEIIDELSVHNAKKVNVVHHNEQSNIGNKVENNNEVKSLDTDESQSFIKQKQTVNKNSQGNKSSIDTMNVFNIGDFTDKQLSPELSILLLEEYELENNQLFNSVNKLFIEKSYVDSLVPLKKLLINVSTLSASNLIHATKSIIKAIENEDYQNMTFLINNLDEQITLFSKVIEH